MSTVSPLLQSSVYSERDVIPVDVVRCAVLLVVRVEVRSCGQTPVIDAARGVHVPAVVGRVVEAAQTHADRRVSTVQLNRTKYR